VHAYSKTFLHSLHRYRFLRFCSVLNQINWFKISTKPSDKNTPNIYHIFDIYQIKNLYTKHFENIPNNSNFVDIYTGWKHWTRVHLLAKPLQLYNSSVDCPRELFKPSKDSASLLACNEKYFFGFRYRFFVGCVINVVGFWSFWLRSPGPGPNR